MTWKSSLSEEELADWRPLVMAGLLTSVSRGGRLQVGSLFAFENVVLQSYSGPTSVNYKWCPRCLVWSLYTRWCELNPSSEIQVCELFSCDLDCWVSRARHNCHVSPRYQHYFTLHCTLPWRGRQPRSSSLWRILRSAPSSEVTIIN